jgi:hypothetical protein
MVVEVPLERRPVTITDEEDADLPYVIVDSYGDKRERFATLIEAQVAAVQINTSR